MIDRPGTLLDCLLRLEGCVAFGARFVGRNGADEFFSYDQVLDRAKRAAGVLQARGIQSGDRVAIILPTGIGFLDAFLGAILAGAIPAALYPPVRLGRLDEYYARTRRMLQVMGARVLVTDATIGRLLGQAVEGADTLSETIDVSLLTRGTSAWTRPTVCAESPAFLQFSSGTTVEPKAVVMSHVNVLANLAMIDTLFENVSDEEAARGGVCWLPLYHDMGLLGCMWLGLYHPGTITYIGPERFIANPALWLQTLSRYRALCSPAPDFAYALCVSKIRDADMEGVNLSSWRYALNGAEPIDVQTLERFSERFSRWGFRPEAMMPVYGLAEAGLAVTFSSPDRPPIVTEFERDELSAHGRARRGRGRRLPSVGRPMPGLEVEIRGEDDRPVADGRVGTIVVRGPSITTGYFGDDALTARTVRAGWLDTGDLGFMYEGELYISGRRKDLIIIRGRNYAPQEIEALTAGTPGLRAGCIVAGGWSFEGEGEQLVVLAEKDARSDRQDEELAADLRDRITRGIGLTPRTVEVLRPGTLPRTSSGKLRRASAIESFAEGRLAPPSRVNVVHLMRELAKSHIAWGRRRIGWRGGAAS